MAPKELGTQQKYRFRFEAENRFCLMGYGATVAMLFLVYQFEIELIRLQDFLTYALLTLGFHSSVQVVGRLGYLDSKPRNVLVSQVAMINWGASFVLACFMVSELRPILLLGSFLTLNFYVGRGDFRQSIGLSILISCFYMSPALVSEFGDQSYPWWTRDSIYLFAFLVSSFHASTVARHNGRLRKEVYRAKLAADKANEELKKSSESALRKALDRVEKANQVKGELLANMSHEFRTPLNAIINVPNILSENIQETPCWLCEACGASYHDEDLVAGLPPPAQAPCPECETQMTVACRSESLTNFKPSQLLARTREAGDYLLYCFDNIMNLSIHEAGDSEIHCSEVLMAQLLHEAVTSIDGRSDYGARTIRIEVDEDALKAYCDADRIREVLLHLLDNALRFSQAPSQVVVAMESVGEQRLRVSVQDHGVGIAKPDHQRIFESFQQVDSSHTRNYDGLGLGLTLASSWVRLHGSSLELQSEPNKGTRFFFELSSQSGAPD